MRLHCIFLVVLILFSEGSSKTFTRCSFAKKLVQLDVERGSLATWVCIAFHESGFNTKKVTQGEDKSKEFGIFQIKNSFWCDKQSGGCGVSCHSLLDCKIEDDLACALHIHHETAIRAFSGGDGFVAWDSYKQHCDLGRADTFLQGCDLPGPVV